MSLHDISGLCRSFSEAENQRRRHHNCREPIVLPSNISKQRCVHYKTQQEFKNSVFEDLFENELDHSFIIGPINKFASETEDFIMLAVFDPQIVNKSGKEKA